MAFIPVKDIKDLGGYVVDSSVIAGFQLSVASAAERQALVVTPSQIGGFVFQQDIQSRFELLGFASNGRARWGWTVPGDVGPPMRTHSFYATGTRFAFSGQELTVIAAGGATNTAVAATPPGNLLTRQRMQTLAAAGSVGQARCTPSSGGSLYSGHRWRSQVVLGIVSPSYRWSSGIGVIVGFPLNVDPNFQINTLSIGCGGSGNVKFYHNDGVGLATEIDLGPNFPGQALEAAYELILYSPLGALSWGYNVRNMQTGIETSGTVTSNIPVDLAVIAIQNFYVSNNTDAQIVGLDIGSLEQWQITR